MRAPLLFLAIAAAACSMGASAGPPAWLVDHVRQEINQDYYDPKDPDGPPMRQPSAKMFKRVDINGDGLADWQVDFNGLANWCGTGGCRLELWLGRSDGGVTPVWGIGVREFKLRPPKAGAPATLDVDVHGSACGGAGVMPCPRRYVWSATEAAFVQAVNAKGDGFLAGLPIDPRDLTWNEAPEVAKAAARRLIEACKASGGALTLEGVGLGRTPDLNGDGIREWYVGSSYPDCSHEVAPDQDPLKLILLVSTPEGGFAPAWETDEADIGFDISAHPASLFRLDTEQDACGLQRTAQCPRTPIRWDAAKRQLIEP